MESPIQAFPLQWPLGWERTKSPRRSQFKNDKTVYSCINELKMEIKRLGGHNLIVSTNIPLKNDGTPYSSYKTFEDKGVAVYFTLKNEQRVLACDKWDILEHNLYAIIKHIEAIRGQERWGVGSIEQAFAGFKALPEQASESTVQPWYLILGLTSPEVDKDQIEIAWKYMAKKFHPDTGGSNEQMAAINKAKTEGLLFISTR